MKFRNQGKNKIDHPLVVLLIRIVLCGLIAFGVYHYDGSYNIDLINAVSVEPRPFQGMYLF